MQADNRSVPEPEAEDYRVAGRDLRRSAPVAPVEVDKPALTRPEDVHDWFAVPGYAGQSGEMRDANLPHCEPLPMPEEADAWGAHGE
jgi:hypothetical protein